MRLLGLGYLRLLALALLPALAGGLSSHSAEERLASELRPARKLGLIAATALRDEQVVEVSADEKGGVAGWLHPMSLSRPPVSFPLDSRWHK